MDEQARKLAIEFGKLSISFLMRKLKVTRLEANRILKLIALENNTLVG